MSRVTSINGLYLFGLPSIQAEKYQKMREATRQKQINKNKQENKVNIEMKRLRETCSIENQFKFLDCLSNSDNDAKTITIMFHNIRSFSHNKKYHITFDHGFRRADVIMLVETHTQLEHTRHIQLDGYDTVIITGSNQKYSSHGQICFVKNAKKKYFSLLAHNATNTTFESTNMLELSLYEYVVESKPKNIYVYICLLYKHPQMKNADFRHEFKQFIHKYFRLTLNKKIDSILFVLGDFNIDFNDKIKMLQFMFDEFGLEPTFKKTKTHDSGSQIDWCFTNIQNNYQICYESYTYETWFSDHKPIWLQIKINS